MFDVFGCRCTDPFSVWSQVFVDGIEPVKKPLERMFEDSASEKSVRAQPSLLDSKIQITHYIKD